MTQPLGAILWQRLREWWCKPLREPDPWEKELDAGVREPEAVPVCPGCARPVDPHQHFCPHCNTSVGDFNTILPFERIFVMGEVLRGGVDARARSSPYRTFAVLMIGLAVSLSTFGLYLPFYVYRHLRNRRGPDAPPPPDS